MNKIAPTLYLTILAIAPSLLLTDRCKSDDTTDPTVRRFFRELQEARATFDRYVVHCTFASSDFAEYPKGLKITYQISKPDEHELIVYDYSGCQPEEKQPATWRGKSSIHIIHGNAGEQSRLGYWSKNHEPMRKTVPQFDVMAIGFGFDVMTIGFDFDELVDYYLKHSSVHVADKEDIALLHSPNGRPRIVIDKKRGSWPIKSELDHAIWTIKLQSFGEFHVPIWFEFTALDGRMEPLAKVTVDLDWEIINEQFPVGQDAAVALAKQHGSVFVNNLKDR